MGLWGKIFRTRATDWTYGRLDPSRVPGNPPDRVIEADAEYLNVFVRSMRIRDVRKGISRFYGTVQSYISLPAAGPDQPVEFHTLITPSRLKDLDPKHLNQVVTLNQRVFGPVPYRGGDLDLELGLLSIKSDDLADPFLSVLEELSSLAGVGIIAQAKPFLAPLKQGIGLLTGSADGEVLEIGLAETISPAQTGNYVVMRAPNGEVEIEDLSLDESGRLLRDGEPVTECPYVVIGIEASATRPDWRSIPDVAAVYEQLSDAVKRQRFDEVHDALSAFKVSVHWCPDLLGADAARIYEFAKAQTDQALGAAQLSSSAAPELPPLSALEL